MVQFCCLSIRIYHKRVFLSSSGSLFVFSVLSQIKNFFISTCSPAFRTQTCSSVCKITHTLIINVTYCSANSWQSETLFSCRPDKAHQLVIQTVHCLSMHGDVRPARCCRDNTNVPWEFLQFHLI